jgi:hypothetical protein
MERFYEPEVKKLFPLQPAQLKRYEGRFKYRGARERYLAVSAKSDRLEILQEWDGQKIDFLPGSSTAFFSPDVGIEIKFIKADDGKVTSLSVFGRDFFDKVN